jgi:carbon monoxide dehydrogenase subunit G
MQGVSKLLLVLASALLAAPAAAQPLDMRFVSTGAEVRLPAARASRIAARPAPAPAADALSRVERARLLSGETITRPIALERGEQRLVGGVSYQLVNASPAEVLAALMDVSSLPGALPRTKSAKLVDTSGRSARVELVQGNSIVEATYTVHLVRESEDLLRFWLDGTRPHDIDDVWGYFRVKPFDGERTLVTVGVALDVGPGLVRMLFEDRIQRVILATPGHIRDFVEQRGFVASR